MSWFLPALVLSLAKKTGFDKWFKGTGESLLNKYTGAGLTGAEREANAFNADEAQKQRDFEREMRDTAFQSQVRDMQAAGINPAMMYGGTGSSGASVPSGASADSVSPSGGDLSSLFSSIMDFALLRAQKENIEADTADKKAAARERNVSADRTEMLTPLEMQNIVSEIDLRDSQMSRIEAEIAVDFANVALLQSDAKVRDEFNRLNLELQKANLAKSEAERNNILQSTDNLKRDFALSFAREAEIKAQTGLLSQQTTNALVENGILRWNEKQSQYEAALTEYNYDHADGNRVWDRVATGASVFRDAGIGVGAVVGGVFKNAVKGASEAIVNSKGNLVKTVLTNQNRNK